MAAVLTIDINKVMSAVTCGPVQHSDSVGDFKAKPFIRASQSLNATSTSGLQDINDQNCQHYWILFHYAVLRIT